MTHLSDTHTQMDSSFLPNVTRIIYNIIKVKKMNILNILCYSNDNCVKN